MILKDDKKKMATLIIKRMKGSSMEPSEQISKKATNEYGDEVDYSVGLESAANEMINAIQSKDVQSLKSALKSFIQMCMDEEESQEEE